MIIQIVSPNSYLLDILYKNPGTDFGVYAKPLKRGVVIGHVVSSNQYDIVFQDTKYSYLPEESNQIDYQSYCNPLVAMDICTEFFSHLLKSKQEVMSKELSWLGQTVEDIDLAKCTIIIPSFYIHSNWVRDGTFLLSKYFSDISIEHKGGYIYSLKIESSTVFNAVNTLSLTALFTHITNNYGIYTFINETFAEKYARILTNLENVPYFIFYLFIKRAVRTEALFEVVKPTFEAYLDHQGMKANLTWHPTHQARIKYISDRLNLKVPILDIGCGELLYYKKMMNLGFSENYYAVDQEMKFEEIAKAFGSRYDPNNLIFYSDLTEYPNIETVNIIISEVIEHNSKDDAIELIKRALSFQFESIIITTPNADFNKYYNENLERRHEDHQFEPTEEEFKQLIFKAIEHENEIDIQFDYIGDCINGIQPTQVGILRKK
jgi:hypothetical protein